jgi:hypothetical protein
MHDTILQHAREQRKRYTTKLFGSSISIQRPQILYTCPQGEILKLRKMA